MAKRSPHDQTCHDNAVREMATDLDRKGWYVKADVPGFQRPSVLNGSRPDIDATKNGHREIIEVETSDSKMDDRQQHENLKKYAASQSDTRFSTCVCET